MSEKLISLTVKTILDVVEYNIIVTKKQGKRFVNFVIGLYSGLLSNYNLGDILQFITPIKPAT